MIRFLYKINKSDIRLSKNVIEEIEKDLKLFLNVVIFCKKLCCELIYFFIVYNV